MKKLIVLSALLIAPFVAPIAHASVFGVATTQDINSLQDQINNIAFHVFQLRQQIDARTGILGSISNPPTSGTTISTGTLLSTVGSPFNVGGNSSSSISGTASTTSHIAELDTIIYLSPNFATVGCAGQPALTDFGACMNALYNSHQATASSVIIMVPVLSFASTSWTTDINFANNEERVKIQCVGGGGSKLSYGGSANAITFNVGNGTTGTHKTGWGIDGCYLQGPNGLGTTKAIVAGGSSGAEGIEITNNTIKGFGTGIDSSANVWEFVMMYNFISNNTTNTVIETASNSGERLIAMYNDSFDPAGTNASSSFVLLNSAVASAFVCYNSFDDSGMLIGTGNLEVVICGNHFENPAHGTYGGYYYIDVKSDNVTHVSLADNMLMNDATSSAESPGGGAAYINCGSLCRARGNVFDKNGASAQTVVGISNNNNGAAHITICDTDTANSSPFSTGVMSAGGVAALTNDGCFYNTGGNYLAGWNYLGNNQSVFYGANNGADLTVTGNVGGVGNNVSNLFAADATIRQGSSTMDIYGSTGKRVLTLAVSSTISASANQAGVYLLNAAGTITLTLPLGTSTQNRDIPIKNINAGTATITATSTDCYRLARATATSSALTLTAGSSTELFNSGNLCGGAGSGTVWEQLWVF